MNRFLLALGLLSGTALAGGGERVATSVILDGASCQPYIGRVVFGVTPDRAASAQMAAILAADQAARQPGTADPSALDWAAISRDDETRRSQTLALLRAGRLSSAQDFFAAGLVFQHGNCPQHYQLANLSRSLLISRSTERSEKRKKCVAPGMETFRRSSETLK